MKKIIAPANKQTTEVEYFLYKNGYTKEIPITTETVKELHKTEYLLQDKETGKYSKLTIRKMSNEEINTIVNIKKLNSINVIKYILVAYATITVIGALISIVSLLCLFN